LVNMEENSTAFGNAIVSWKIAENSKQVNVVYKRMRSFVRLLDSVTTYEDFYNVLKLLRPSEKYEVVSVVLKGDIWFNLHMIEPDVYDNDSEIPV